MQPLSDRTAGFTDSVIRRMTRISNQYGAVNLSQGFPDFDPPKAILDRLAEVAHEDYHQYAITWGAQNFREALAKKQSHFMGRDIAPTGEIVVTCGSTEAMMAAMMTVANPGDKVVIFSPFFESYGADTLLSGAERIYVHTTLDGIRTNRAAEVIASSGGLVPGLYAAGECAGGIFGGDRLGGAGMTACCVMGREAGSQAAARAKELQAAA